MVQVKLLKVGCKTELRTAVRVVAEGFLSKQKITRSQDLQETLPCLLLL